MMLNQRYANADIVFLMRGATNNKPIIESLAKIMPDLDERICNQLEIQSGYRLELRYKVCGYSDVISSGSPGWWVESPFTRDIHQAAKEMGAMELHEGGDGLQPLLDGLWLLAKMPAAKEGYAADELSWRHWKDARRFVIVFSNATCHMTTHFPEAGGATFDDVAREVIAARLRVCLYAPEADCYYQISAIDRCEWEIIGDTSNAVEKMVKFAYDTDRLVPQLAKNMAGNIAMAEALPARETPTLNSEALSDWPE